MIVAPFVPYRCKSYQYRYDTQYRYALPARPLFIVTVTANQTSILTNQNGNLTPRPPRGMTPSSSGGPPSRSGSEPSDSADESAPEVIGNSYRNTAQSPPQRTGAVAPTSRPLLSMDPSEGGRRNTPIYPRDWDTPFPTKPAFEGLRHRGRQTPQRNAMLTIH